MDKQLASILVGDHLGQVKKVLWPSGEVVVLTDLPEPNSSNPIVSIEPIGKDFNRHLIGNKNGDIFIYDSIKGKIKKRALNSQGPLIRAIPSGEKDIIFIYEKHITFVYHDRDSEMVIRLKKGQIKDAKVCEGKLAIIGQNIPLQVFDIKTRNKIYEAEPPKKDWLGVRPECDVAGVDFVSPDRVVTCSKSDSVVRVYDIKSDKTLPTIEVELGQTAFNEYAEAGRFLSISSASSVHSASTKTIVVGSNVGQLIAIDLKLNVKQKPKKKLQPKTYKILGGFKGSRGATYKNLKIFQTNTDGMEYKVISCCLDRYLRVHNLSRTSGRSLEKHVYLKTKPMCCSLVLYRDE